MPHIIKAIWGKKIILTQETQMAQEEDCSIRVIRVIRGVYLILCFSVISVVNHPSPDQVEGRLRLRMTI